MQGVKLEDLSVTDEDLVPLELFDQVLLAKEAKHEAKKQQIIGLIGKLKNEAANKIKSIGEEREK